MRKVKPIIKITLLFCFFYLLFLFLASFVCLSFYLLSLILFPIFLAFVAHA